MGKTILYLVLAGLGGLVVQVVSPIAVNVYTGGDTKPLSWLEPRELLVIMIVGVVLVVALQLALVRLGSPKVISARSPKAKRKIPSRARRNDPLHHAAVAVTPATTGFAGKKELATVQVDGGIRFVNAVPVVPEIKFLDRIQEMQRLRGMLANPAVRLIVLFGVTGVGKTTLISNLVHELKGKGGADLNVGGFVYLSAHGYRKITAGTVLYDLVEAVADEDLAARLHQRILEPMPWRDKLKDVLEAFAGSGAVVVIDDFEDLVDESGRLQDLDLGEVIQDVLGHGGHGVRLVLVTRDDLVSLRKELSAPSREIGSIELDKGLLFDDAEAFLKSHSKRSLSAGQVSRVYQLTNGRPRSLELFVGILSRAPGRSPEWLLSNLAGDEQGVAIGLLDLALKRLDQDELRVVQALAVYARPVPPEAVSYLLRSFTTKEIESGPILDLLHDWRLVRRDGERYFLPPEPDAQRVRDGIPHGEIGDLDCDPLPDTLVAWWHRAADYFNSVSRDDVDGVEQLRPQLSEIELRILAGEYDTAVDLMAKIDDDYLTRWGYSDALVPWREWLKERLTDGQAHNLSYLVAARQQQEHFTEVREELRTALRYVRFEPKNRIRLRIQMATAYFNDGWLNKAAWWYRLTVWQCRWQGMRQEGVSARLNLALCQARMGRLGSAQRHFRATHRAASRLPDNDKRSEQQALILLNEGWVCGQLECEEALDKVRRAKEYATQSPVNALLEGRCLNAEAARLIDSGKASYAIPPAIKAKEIGERTSNAPLTCEAYLSLALAYLCSGDESDESKAADAADAGARLSSGTRALGVLGLQGITAFRKGDKVKARSAFNEAAHKASSRLEREKRDYQAWETKGLALCGLALCGDRGSIAESVYAYRKARARTRARGAIERNRLLLGQFGESADPDILARVRRASEGA